MSIRTSYYKFGGAVCAGAMLLISSIAQAQNLLIADEENGNIYEYLPSGAQSTFASGLTYADALAFDGAGDLFVLENMGAESERGRVPIDSLPV